MQQGSVDRLCSVFLHTTLWAVPAGYVIMFDMICFFQNKNYKVLNICKKKVQFVLRRVP